MNKLGLTAFFFLSLVACGPSSPDAPACNLDECGAALTNPRVVCADGSMGGPTGQCIEQDGYCAWEDRACPGPDLQACGSRGLDVCPAGEFCDWDEAAICGRADAPGVCRPQPAATARCITTDFSPPPVCGCDGLNYRNECEANRAGVSAEYTGTCLGAFAGETR